MERLKTDSVKEETDSQGKETLSSPEGQKVEHKDSLISVEKEEKKVVSAEEKDSGSEKALSAEALDDSKDEKQPSKGKEMRVYELAKELNIKSIDLVHKIRKDWNIPVRSYMEALTPDLEKKIRKHFESEKKAVKKVKTKRVVKKSIIQKKTEEKVSPKTPLEQTPVKKNIIRRKAVEVKPLVIDSEKKPVSEKPEVSKKTAPSLKEDLIQLTVEPEELLREEEKKKVKKTLEKRRSC